MLQAIKTTVIGGIVFLFPVVVFFALLREALELTGAIADPLVAALSPAASVGGVAIAHIVAALLVLVLCFLAGLIARTAVARAAVHALEERVLSNIPAYALLKTRTQSLLSPEDIEDMSPVVVHFDDSLKFAFEVERVAKTQVAVFLPGAPDAWSGSLCVVEVDRVTPLDLSVPFVAKMAKRLGRGADEALRDRVVDRAPT